MVTRFAWALFALGLIVVLIVESARYGWAIGSAVIVFLLLPDVALIGAFDRARPGSLKPERVAFYNALHRPWPGLVLLAIGALLFLPALGGAPALGGVPAGRAVAAAGLAWLAHVAVDRASGYGLRDAAGAIRPVGGLRAPARCQA